jgi:hypothetical protein
MEMEQQASKWCDAKKVMAHHIIYIEKSVSGRPQIIGRQAGTSIAFAINHASSPRRGTSYFLIYHQSSSLGLVSGR